MFKLKTTHGANPKAFIPANNPTSVMNEKNQISEMNINSFYKIQTEKQLKCFIMSQNDAFKRLNNNNEQKELETVCSNVYLSARSMIRQQKELLDF